MGLEEYLDRDDIPVDVKDAIRQDIAERKQAEEKIKNYTENLEKLVEEKSLELKDSEERYRGLYETSIDGIGFADREGNIVDCNQALVDILGYTKEELRNLTYWQLIPRKWQDVLKKVREKTDVRCYSNEFKIEVVRKDGEWVPISVKVWENKETDGTPNGTWTIVRDITERKKLEKKLNEYTENLRQLIEKWTQELKESEESYRGLYESSIDGIAHTDMDQKIVDCNQAFADMLGYTKEELYHLTLWDLTPSKWYDMNQKIFTEQVFARGYSENYEKEYIRKDRTIVPVSARAWVIKDKEGNPTGSWGIVRDITERKRLDQMKSQFINLAAHELRTPLSALKAHVDLLKIKSDLGYWQLPEEVYEKINIVARNTDRLAVLINNLLDYTRLEASTVRPKMKLGSLDIIISQVIKELLPLAKKRGHTLDLHTPKMLPLICMDKAMIHAIFHNLFSNAVKYTPDGGKIEVKILEEQDYLHLTVKDTGIGIPEEDLEKIFQLFYVTNISESARFQSEFERTGLGLAITKEYVKMHGGSIWAESKVDEGSTFHVLFPKKKDEI